MSMPPASPRERVAVIRALLAAVDAELDQIVQALAPGNDANEHAHELEWLDTECPECGIKWRYISPECPRRVYNRHPLGGRPPLQA